MPLFPSITYSAIVVSRELAVTYPIAKLLFLSDSSIHETGGGGLSPKVKHRAILEVVFFWLKRKTSEDTVGIVKEMLGEPTPEEYKQFYPPQLSLNTFLYNCIKSSAQQCLFYGDVVRDCYVMNESTVKRIDIIAYDSKARLFDKLYRCHIAGRRPSDALLYSDRSSNSCAVKSSNVYECIIKETGESVIFTTSELRSACQSKCLSVDNLALDTDGNMAVLRGYPFLVSELVLDIKNKTSRVDPCALVNANSDEMNLDNQHVQQRLCMLRDKGWKLTGGEWVDDLFVPQVVISSCKTRLQEVEKRFRFLKRLSSEMDERDAKRQKISGKEEVNQIELAPVGPVEEYATAAPDDDSSSDDDDSW